MKSAYFLLFIGLSLFASPMFAQDTKTAQITWVTDYKQALEQAKKENKSLLLNFTGSDWCGWCIRLQNEVFSKAEFAEWANKNLVCVKLDFPRRKVLPPAESTQNEQLAQSFGISGFPTIVLVDGQGKSFGRTGYKAGGPLNYVQHLQSFIGARK